MAGLYFIDKGKGTTALLFLHFFGGSSYTWIKVIEDLSQYHRCIAVDLNGFGRSRISGRSTILQEQTDLLLEFIHDLQLEDFTLVGHSMGGKIALSVASHQPAGLKSLILVAPSPPTPEPMDDAQRSAMENAFGNRPAVEEIVRKLTVEPLENNFFQEVVNDHLSISHEAWHSWLEEGTREDISAETHKISVPVSIVSGANDSNFSTTFLRKEFEKYFKDATVAEIPNAGHLIPLEQSEALSALIKSFLPAGKEE